MFYGLGDKLFFYFICIFYNFFTRKIPSYWHKKLQLIEDTKNSVKENIESTTNSVKEAVQQEVVNKVEEKIEETTTATKEQLNSTQEKLKSIANKPVENK